MQGAAYDDEDVSGQEDEILFDRSTTSAPGGQRGLIHTSIGSRDCLRDDECGAGHRLNREKTRHVRPTSQSSPSNIGRRLLFINDGGPRSEVRALEKAGPVKWRDLPNKGQLVLLTLARLSEPLTQNSLQAYMFYQLKSFDQSLPDSTIASQARILQGSFTAAQFLTAILWGRAADADWGGRKKVLLVGLLGTCISCVGFGFSRSFRQTVFFRILEG